MLPHHASWRLAVFTPVELVADGGAQAESNIVFVKPFAKLVRPSSLCFDGDNALLVTSMTGEVRVLRSQYAPLELPRQACTAVAGRTDARPGSAWLCCQGGRRCSRSAEAPAPAQVLQFAGPAHPAPGTLQRVLLSFEACDGLPWGLLWARGLLFVTLHNGGRGGVQPCIRIYSHPAGRAGTGPTLLHCIKDPLLEQPNTVAWDEHEGERTEPIADSFLLGTLFGE